MRCLRRSSPMILTLLIFIFLVNQVYADRSITLPRRPIYFLSKSDSYITFNTDTLPLTFTSLYRDSTARWYFSDSWVTTTTDMTIDAFFSDDWFNYSISAGGTQELYYPTEPTEVYIDGTKRKNGDGWTYLSLVSTVTTASSNVRLYYGAAETSPEGGLSWGPSPPAYRPENYTWQPPLWRPEPVTPVYFDYGLLALVILVLGAMFIGLTSKLRKQASRKSRFKSKMRVRRSTPRDYARRMKKPKRK